MQAHTAVPAAQAGPAPKPRRKRSSATHPTGDEQYQHALAFVKGRGFGSLNDLVELGVPRATAREILERMQREGVLQAPDMFGTWKRQPLEVCDEAR